MSRIFGTDGIRGPFGEPPLVRSTVTAVGRAVADHLTARLGEPPQLIAGGDTRESSPTLISWFAEGAESGGASIRWAGVVPTPAIAMLVRDEDADCGVAISASHNAHPDNGIKLIGPDGFKWSVEDEMAVEALVGASLTADTALATAETDVPVETGLVDRYCAHLARTIETRLAGVRLVLDSANGAASPIAASFFSRLGATVISVGDQPDGQNINDGCGSTAPARVAAAVLEHGADLGFAFDGDADRAIAVDERGVIRNGDAMLYVWASYLADRDDLPQRRIVATTMSNLGLEVALAARDIEIVRCDVGDRIVVETLQRENLRLGGEQSGHLVDLDKTTSGDGMLTAATIAGIVRTSGEPFSELLSDFRRFPQVLKNVIVERKPPLDSLPRVGELARDIEERLGSEGRLVLRYSGTEPLARVMIEGPSTAVIHEMADSLLAAIGDEIGA